MKKGFMIEMNLLEMELLCCIENIFNIQQNEDKNYLSACDDAFGAHFIENFKMFKSGLKQSSHILIIFFENFNRALES